MCGGDEDQTVLTTDAALPQNCMLPNVSNVFQLDATECGW